MWWLLYLSACAVMLPCAEDRRARFCIAAFAVGLLAMQAWKVLDMGHWQWLASAAVWAAVTVACWRHSVTFATMTLVSAMCYAIGRVGAFDFAPYMLPIVLADVFGVAALLYAGGPGVTRMVGRIRRGGVVDRGVSRPSVAARLVVPETAKADAQ